MDRTFPPRKTRPVHAFVKISDGCDRACAFCAIPLIKGDYRTLTPQAILESARAALGAGARELVLVGQETSRWEQPGWGGLERLLAELTALEPAPLWLRLLYLQPEGIDDALLEAMARYAVHYVDIPLQHASGPVLRRMRRAGDGDGFLRLLERIRAVMPGVAIRSTFIAGSPGETEEEFAELLDFVRAAGLAAAGVFVFDPQEGTSAAGMGDQIAADVALRIEPPSWARSSTSRRRVLAGSGGTVARRARRERHEPGGRCRRRSLCPPGARHRRSRAAQWSPHPAGRAGGCYRCRRGWL